MTEEGDPADRETLDFEADRGASRSKWVAALLVVGLVGWLGSGFVLPSGDESAPQRASADPDPVAVAVRTSTERAVQQVFVAEGQAQPDRETQVQAGISGEIAEVPVRKGAEVAKGDVILRFELAGRQEDLTRAQEAVSRAERDFQNAQTLLDKGTATVDRVAETRSARAAARADLAAAKQAIEDTEVRAPFAGRVEALSVDPGEFVATGAEVARITDTSPLTVAIQVPQQKIAKIETGQHADVTFITGAERKGEVTFVGRSADPATRTFSVEVRVPNDDGAIPAGISAEVRIPTGDATGHLLSPAILSLDTDGTLGVKTVDPQGRVAFHEVSIIRAQTDGIWVSGLPRETRIITVGQGFVDAGDAVDPSPAEESPAATAQARAEGIGE